MGIEYIKGSRKRRHLRIKYTRKCTDRINGKRLLNSVVSISVTNKKLGEAADETGAEVGTCLINKWRAKINQERLYNVKVNAPRKGLGKMAKNQSLSARLLEKDS